MSPLRTIRIGYAVLAAGVLVNLAICAFRSRRYVAWNVLPIFIYTIGSSLIMPSVTLLLLDLFPTMRGMTSSLQGSSSSRSAPSSRVPIAPLLAHVAHLARLGHGGIHGRKLRPVARVSAARALDT